jgi:hypothetical protein
MNRESESTADIAEAARLAAQFDAWLVLTGQSPTRTGQAPAPDGPVHLPMLSGSMSPALPPGCTLEIDPRDPAGFLPGEVVVMALDDRLVAHRAVLRWRWRGQVSLLEMGDANPRGAWRPARVVVGRVVRVTTAAGMPLPAPTSRALALRGLLRHVRGLLRPAAGPEEPPQPDGNQKHDD